MTSMARLLVVLALAVVACGPPQPGDPCEPGSPYIVVDGDPPVVLLCAASVGCDPPPVLRWTPYYGGSYARFCGCDGVTRNNDLDFGGPPNYPYRWYGSCEAGPCDSVFFDGGWRSHAYVGGSVPEQCTDCTRALLRDAECVGPDGLSMPMDCCRCDFAVLDESGTCVYRDAGFEMPAFCCE